MNNVGIFLVALGTLAFIIAFAWSTYTDKRGYTPLSQAFLGVGGMFTGAAGVIVLIVAAITRA